MKEVINELSGYQAAQNEWGNPFRVLTIGVVTLSVTMQLLL
jgi:hypothetical protein